MMFKEKKPIYLDYQVILLIILLIIFSILIYLRFNEPILNEKVVPDYKLLNTLSEDKVLNITSFIIKDKEEDYLNYINNKTIEYIPSDIYTDIINNNLDYYYVFNDSYLTLNYDLSKIYDCNKTIEVPIVYNDIKNMINIDYDENITYTPKEVTYKYALSLTFDDSPNGDKTLALLSYLKEYNYTATFFMVANKLNNYADTVKAVYDSGNEIGYHSYNHSYFTKQSTSKIKKELELSNSIYYDITGDYFKIVRPPYGSYNNKTVDTLNMPMFIWSVDTNDWKYRDSEYIYNYIIEHNEAKDIILMHDSYQTTIDAVRNVLKYFYINDIKVLSIKDLAEYYGVTIENEVYRSFK